ncbi:MAG: sensor histidine kinase [Clostridia bacterium]|nr:sensor histidine kinase [Clostridia bacterium]
MRLRMPVGAVLIACFLFVIAILAANIRIMQQEYDQFHAGFAEEYQQLIRLIGVREDVRAMYQAAAGMAEMSDDALPALERQYIEAFAHAMKELDGLEASSGGRMRYYIVDVVHMFESFDADYQEYRALRGGMAELIYLRQASNALKRLGGYIENELDAASAFRTIESKAVYDRSIEKFSTVRLRAYLLLAAMVTLCVVICVLVARAVTRPLRALALRMHSFVKTGVDNPPAASIRASFAEVDELVESYSAMIQELTHKQELESELSRQQMDNLTIRGLLQRAELDMLQMQMNPHFLFNTLNSIGALAQLENAPRAGEMVERLSGILRHSLTALTQFVQLDSEVAVAADYIAIQQMRFDGKPGYVERIDKEARAAQVPCMMIQPLIENAVLHAFPKLKECDMIQLIVQTRPNGLEIAVEDNGIGLEPSHIERLLSGRDTADARRGIGLINVIRRMRILYGDGYVTITSKPGEGTRVVLNLPNATKNASLMTHPPVSS